MAQPEQSNTPDKGKLGKLRESSEWGKYNTHPFDKPLREVEEAPMPQLSKGDSSTFRIITRAGESFIAVPTQTSFFDGYGDSAWVVQPEGEKDENSQSFSSFAVIAWKEIKDSSSD